ncbi:MAG: hypothetical protein HC898_00260 [Phycisphaerales bacterium]|nr:hypothetical protein [Phycisphaerales bacterium]
MPANANEPTANASLVKSPLQFAGGRGATLFTWQGQLTFDVAGNDMTMVDTVQMTHRPADSPHIVTLDCSRFMADLQPTGGLSSWASGTAPQPDLRSITALGPVNVTVGGNNPLQVQTSKLVYDGKAQSVLLQAEPGSMTTVQETGQPGISAEAIRWDLTQQRWEIIRPGAGRLPLGR